MGQCYHDIETDHFENWHRYHSPDTGRYLSPEPRVEGRPIRAIAVDDQCFDGGLACVRVASSARSTTLEHCG